MQMLPHIAISHPAWLFAHTFSLAGLVVYRSPLVKDTDAIYAPVASALAGHELRLVLKESIPDESMMFGTGELEVYRYASAPYPDNPHMSALEFAKKLKTGDEFD